MARLSLADRLKRGGKTTQEELDKSKALIKKISKTKGDREEPSKPLTPETDEQADRQTDNQADRQFNKQIDRQFNKQIDRQFNKQIDRQLDRSVTEQINRQIDRHVIANPFYWMTEKQAIILAYLVSQENFITRLDDIVKSTGIAYGTTRGAIKRLVSEGCISQPRRYRRGRFHGISYVVNDTVCSKFMEWNSNRQLPQQIERQTVTKTDRKTDFYIEEEDIYILLLSTEHITHIYPKLSSTGFEQKHLKEIIESWKFQKLDPHELSDSLERAEWAVKHNDKIKDPLNYVYSSLMKGPFAKPAGFVSKAENEAQEKVEEAKRIQALNEEAEKLEFENWWRGLSKDEQDAVDAMAKVRSMAKKDGPAIRGHRMNCFREGQGKISNLKT